MWMWYTYTRFIYGVFALVLLMLPYAERWEFVVSVKSKFIQKNSQQFFFFNFLLKFFFVPFFFHFGRSVVRSLRHLSVAAKKKNNNNNFEANLASVVCACKNEKSKLHEEKNEFQINLTRYVILFSLFFSACVCVCVRECRCMHCARVVRLRCRRMHSISSWITFLSQSQPEN